MNFRKVQVLTFDCYGTLIDWESGILSALQPVLANHHIDLSDAEILENYAQFESALESGAYMNYRTVLRETVSTFGKTFDFDPSESERKAIETSLPDWQPFSDTVAALRALKTQFKLGILSNIDRDLFQQTARHLGVNFDYVITAEDLKSYKPSPNNFDGMIQRIGIPKEQILHVAQSLFHDILPAKKLGLSTVWVNRRHKKKRSGATPPAQVQPDVTVPDLSTLVSLMQLK